MMQRALRVDRGHHEDRLAVLVADPVIYEGTQAQSLTRHKTRRQFGLRAMVQALMPIDREHTGQVGIALQESAGDLRRIRRHRCRLRHAGKACAQGLHLWAAVEPQQQAHLAGRGQAQQFQLLDAQQRQLRTGSGFTNCG